MAPMSRWLPRGTLWGFPSANCCTVLYVCVTAVAHQSNHIKVGSGVASWVLDSLAGLQPRHRPRYGETTTTATRRLPGKLHYARRSIVV